MEQRAAVMTSAERRAILARAAGVIVDAARVCKDAERTIPASAPAVYLVSIRSETSAIMASASLAIRKVAGGAYADLYTTPIKLAVAVLDDLATMGGTKPKAKTPANKAARQKHTLATFRLLKTTSADGAPMISGIASATSIDYSGDRFALGALKMMRAAFPGKSLWIDHQYNAVESLAGRMTEAHIVKTADGEHNLIISAQINTENQRAMQAYRSLKAGMTLDFSVGVIVNAQQKTGETYRGQDVWEITDCTPIEVSLVAIGAQPRAQVTGAS